MEPLTVKTEQPISTEGEAEVERILGSCKIGQKLWYLIQWKGFDDQHVRWAEGSSLIKAQQRIAEFQTEFGKANTEHPKILSPAGQLWEASKSTRPSVPLRMPKLQPGMSSQSGSNPSVSLEADEKVPPGPETKPKSSDKVSWPNWSPERREHMRRLGLERWAKYRADGTAQRIRQRHLDRWASWRRQGLLFKKNFFGCHTPEELSQLRRQQALKRWAKWRADGTIPHSRQKGTESGAKWRQQGQPFKKNFFGCQTAEELSAVRRQQALTRWKRFRATGKAEEIMKKLHAGQLRYQKQMTLRKHKKRVSPVKNNRTTRSKLAKMELEESCGSSTTKLVVKEEESDEVKQESEDTDEHYEVDRIIAAKMVGRNIVYLTKWKGYDDSYNTWQQARSMCSARKSVMDFVNEFGKVSATNSRIFSPEGIKWSQDN